MQTKIFKHLFFSILLITSACGGGDNNTSSTDQPYIATLSVTDPLDTSSGIDITQVDIIPEGEDLRLTISCSDQLASIPSDLIIYLYGTNRDRLSFNSGLFELRRDNNADGVFEEKITEGPIQYPDPMSISILLNQAFLDDIYLKQIWLYSVSNQERVPDVGTLNLGIYPEAMFDIYNFQDNIDPMPTADLLEMKISINEDVVIFTTSYSEPIPDGYFRQIIYLYGDNSPKFIAINYLRSSQLYLDNDQDGLSSDMIFSGGCNLISTNELEIQIPRAYLPDIFSKQIWVESSDDRLPDTGFIILQ